MDNKKIDELYLRVKYLQKLVNNIEKSDLESMESDIYNNLSDDKKIDFELSNLIVSKEIINDSESLFKRIAENIKALIEDEKNNNVDNTSELKKQITLLQVLLNKQIGFYESLSEIDKDYIEKSLNIRR